MSYLVLSIFSPLPPVLLIHNGMQLRYHRVGEEGDWEVHNPLTTINNATSTQVTGLQPYAVYSFRVVAVNGIGPSIPSRESYYMVTLREGINKLLYLIRLRDDNELDGSLGCARLIWEALEAYLSLSGVE